MPYWMTVEDPEYFDDDQDWQDSEDLDEDLMNEQFDPFATVNS